MSDDDKIPTYLLDVAESRATPGQRMVPRGLEDTPATGAEGWRRRALEAEALVDRYRVAVDAAAEYEHESDDERMDTIRTEIERSGRLGASVANAATALMCNSADVHRVAREMIDRLEAAEARLSGVLIALDMADGCPRPWPEVLGRLGELRQSAAEVTSWRLSAAAHGGMTAEGWTVLQRLLRDVTQWRAGRRLADVVADSVTAWERAGCPGLGSDGEVDRG